MTDDELGSLVRAVVNDLVTDSVAAHKRRCAIAAGVRESGEIACDRHDWDYAKHWCRRCGMMERDIAMERYT